MSEDDASQTPLLDECRAQVGDEAVAAADEVARAQVADCSLPRFFDRDELLECLRGQRRRSA